MSCSEPIENTKVYDASLIHPTRAGAWERGKNEFMRAEVADAFLIAVAKSYDYVIVTHEKRDGNSKKRVIIPNIAAEYGIECIMLHDLLCRYAQGNFSLKT